MIFLVIAFTAAVTFMTVHHDEPSAPKTSKELYQEGIGNKK
jgi:hypothetical protein